MSGPQQINHTEYTSDVAHHIGWIKIRVSKCVQRLLETHLLTDRVHSAHHFSV